MQSYEKTDGRVIHRGSGTAWSVRPGLLATNAHVAKMVEDAGPNGYVIARRGDSSNDLRITKARLHPGWREHEKMWYDYRPYVPERLRLPRAMLRPPATWRCSRSTRTT